MANAGVTIFVVDLNDVDHQLDNVTDITIDSTSFAAILDGTYRNEGPIYIITEGAGTGGGIPEPGVATVGSEGQTANTPLFPTSGSLPATLTANGLVMLPDSVSGTPPYPNKNPQSVVKFTHSVGGSSPFATYSTFWFMNKMKGIKTSSASYTVPKSLWT